MSPYRKIAPKSAGASTTLDGLEVTVVAPDHKALDKLAEKWREAVARDEPAVIAAAYADRTVPNLSSIALHFRRGARTALVTGDARGDHVLAGLERAGLAPAEGPLDVDVFKLPHHGSPNNAAPSLFERVHADHYVVSADGIKHHHPGETTLEWLVASRAPSDQYIIHLTNPIPFALAKLEKLRRGRRFAINVRASDAKGIAIDLET